MASETQEPSTNVSSETKVVGGNGTTNGVGVGVGANQMYISKDGMALWVLGVTALAGSSCLRPTP